MSAPRRALVVIDAQREYFDGLLPIQYPPREESIARIGELAAAAKSASIPVVVVKHEYRAGAPVFAAGSQTWQIHPALAECESDADKRVVKTFASVFAGTGLADWLDAQSVDTVTLVGYMTNNCVLGSAAAAEPLGFAVEVISDATGAIDLANEAGSANAQQVHETLMALLHSNWAAVTDGDGWKAAVEAVERLERSDLRSSAARGRVMD
ncbi:MAG: cysteine hydrolase family protein [Gordonia sp. (in: high G+C Gram-positive bacteria)]